MQKTNKYLFSFPFTFLEGGNKNIKEKKLREIVKLLELKTQIKKLNGSYHDSVAIDSDSCLVYDTCLLFR